MRDSLDDSQVIYKYPSDAKGRGCIERYEAVDLGLIDAKNLSTNVVSAVFKTKLRPRFMVPFTVVA